jgi:hypothetical protein
MCHRIPSVCVVKVHAGIDTRSRMQFSKGYFVIVFRYKFSSYPTFIMLSKLVSSPCLITTILCVLCK